MKKLLSLLLAMMMLVALAAPALASDEASGETADASAEAAEETEEETGPIAVIVITDEGEDEAQEQTEGIDLTFFDGGEQTETGISGFLMTSDDSQAALYYSELSEDTGAFYTIGGDVVNVALDEYDVTEIAAQWLEALGVEGFDSAVVLGDGDEADSCSPVISAKGYTYLNIANTLVLASGTARSAMYSDVVGGTTVAGPGAGGMSQGSEEPVVVITGSLLETLGGPEEQAEDTITVTSTGNRARGIQPQGKSITYLYDSAIVSHTWGAWSTDSARVSLDLVAYRSLGLSQGGYGAYADTSCHLFLYGSTVMGSSDGIVASNDGEIYAVSSDCTDDSATLRAIMDKSGDRALSWQDYETEEGDVMESVISGGATAVQFHMPDQGHSGAGNTRKGTLYMNGGTLSTDESLIDGGAESLDAYELNYAGACIVTKSTQANILLEGVEMESWSGVLIHAVINNDSNVNNIADGDEALGSDITLRDMDVTGDIVNDDYQRAMRLYLDNTTLTGAIYSNTCEDWNALCEAEFDGEYILNEDGYETVWGVEITLANGSVWNVTETSVVSELIINDGCTINGVITENEDGTLTISPLETTASGEAS
ncbi:MAG: hypothetical protein LUH42_06490 [Oscillospiraceae bacterium]|nr:hypothetical protein [Oscillospiraceae bacterium]